MRVERLGETRLSRLVTGRLTIETRGAGFTDITAPLNAYLGDEGAGRGVLVLFVTHTTASLTVQENADPDVRRDLTTALSRLAPTDGGWRHGTEGPDDMPAHIKAVLSDTSLAIPVEAGRMGLGTWQAVYLIEHRAVPHRRTVEITYIGD